MTATQEIPVREAAKRVHRSPETIRRWIWSGRLPATKRGNTYYVDVMRLEGIAVEMGITLYHGGNDQTGAVTGGTHRLDSWLAELERWKDTISNRATRETASDLVIEDRHARR